VHLAAQGKREAGTTNQVSAERSTVKMDTEVETPESVATPRQTSTPAAAATSASVTGESSSRAKSSSPVPELEYDASRMPASDEQNGHSNSGNGNGDGSGQSASEVRIESRQEDETADLVVQEDGKRVKVYELREQSWHDRGTGHCKGIYDDSQDLALLVVEAEDGGDKEEGGFLKEELLLSAKVERDDIYARQQGELLRSACNCHMEMLM
jgi:protein phosphatase-4 regulatory subunit 3